MRLPAPSPSPSPLLRLLHLRLLLLLLNYFLCNLLSGLSLAVALLPASFGRPHIVLATISAFRQCAQIRHSPWPCSASPAPHPSARHRQLTIASPRATGPDLGQVALEISKINSHHLNHRQRRQELARQWGKVKATAKGEKAAPILLPLCNPFSVNRQRVKLVS